MPDDDRQLAVPDLTCECSPGRVFRSQAELDQHRRRLHPDVIRVSADDVELPGEHQPWRRRMFGQAGMTTDINSPCYPYKCVPGCPHIKRGNLRTPEADATACEEPSWMRDAIGQSIEHVEDPSLRRALREEYHRS